MAIPNDLNNILTVRCIPNKHVPKHFKHDHRVHVREVYYRAFPLDIDARVDRDHTIRLFYYESNAFRDSTWINDTHHIILCKGITQTRKVFKGQRLIRIVELLIDSANSLQESWHLKAIRRTFNTARFIKSLKTLSKVQRSLFIMKCKDAQMRQSIANSLISKRELKQRRHNDSA